MVSRSKQIHRRHALLLAVLFLTLPFAVRAVDLAQSSPPPIAPAATPAPAPAASAPQPDAVTTPPAPPPAQPLPATGGGTIRDVPATPNASPIDLPDKTGEKPKSEGVEQKDKQPDNTPIELPIVKPIAYNAERDFEIGRKVGELMEVNHYLQRPVDQEMSQRWLKNYLDALDYNHLFFLKSDVDEFTAKYGNNLGDLLLHSDNEDAAIAPAFDIFNRYMQRLDENVVLAEKLLHENYDFSKDETYAVRTNKSPWMPDAATSQAVWRGQVKLDLLNGLLDKKASADTIKRVSKRYASLLRTSTLAPLITPSPVLVPFSGRMTVMPPLRKSSLAVRRIWTNA